jgi:hypothetical protein
MDDVPTCAVVPPLRCCHRETGSSDIPCGQAAAWSRAEPGTATTRFYCDQHRAATDSPIPAAFTFARVRVHLEVLLSGVGGTPAADKHEAVALVRRAVEAAGGLVNLVAVFADTARGGSLAAPGGERGARGVSA